MQQQSSISTNPRIVTLFLIVVIVFLIANVFPSDVGRRLAGPFAPQEQVDAVNEALRAHLASHEQR